MEYSFLPNQIEIFLMLFVDDFVLLSAAIMGPGPQNQLSLLYESSRRLVAKTNTDKAKIIVLRKGGHLAPRENWLFWENRDSR